MGTKYHRCPPDEMELRAPRYDSTRAVGGLFLAPILPRARVRPSYSHPCQSLYASPWTSHLRGPFQNGDYSTACRECGGDATSIAPPLGNTRCRPLVPHACLQDIRRRAIAIHLDHVGSSVRP